MESITAEEFAALVGDASIHLTVSADGFVAALGQADQTIIRFADVDAATADAMRAVAAEVVRRRSATAAATEGTARAKRVFEFVKQIEARMTPEELAFTEATLLKAAGVDIRALRAVESAERDAATPTKEEPAP